MNATRTALKSGDDVEPEVRIRRLHRRDLNRTWEFLKQVFREVNRTTVEYQRPRSKKRFLEVYEEKGIEQLLFVVSGSGKEQIVGYAECALAILGTDNWMNERYFRMRDMRPLFVEELAVHPDFQGRGLGSFVLDQLEHLARLRGCTHLVLEVAENNNHALKFYRTRSFYKLDAAVFLAKKVVNDAELLPPRPLSKRGATAVVEPVAPVVLPTDDPQAATQTTSKARPSTKAPRPKRTSAAGTRKAKTDTKP
ncbi:GNAT family N-acetyltransferase [Phreatobacter stygius]|uniref:GNAT family N-acetyltransferase n=2 Tax=Phreatobacter stygius TaxID=1940610 RepID=A0A4D7BE60_9HYPH|nr:GNAT family N-acetyltransferase [Phreatobacter stygius]